MLSGIVSGLFGGDVPIQPIALYQVALRATLLFLVSLCIVHFGKSRLISRITPLDALLGFILGSLVGRGITGSASLSGTIIATAALVGVHWILSALACRSHRLGNFLKGECHLIIQDGKIDTAALRRSHLSENDLIEQLRLNGVENVADVKLSYKERNGEISVIRR